MSKTVLITGCAGFIGYHSAIALHKRGDKVIGLDNFNNYYDPDLKFARAQNLKALGIHIIKGDLSDKACLKALFDKHPITHVLNLAAQAGVRYARINPDAYVKSNIEGFVALLEQLKLTPHIPLIYASSSSVYGANNKVPFSVEDPTDKPANLYAASKKANEVMAFAYHHMYGLKTTGLRFFTVYGPWGRPDMAYYSFSQAILDGTPITLYNQGQMWRDFTYIDDIVDGTLAAIDKSADCAVYNLGNNQPESLQNFVSILEALLGKKAHIQLADFPSDEMIKTYADIDKSKKDLFYEPKVDLKEGLKHFVDWFKLYQQSR